MNSTRNIIAVGLATSLAGACAPSSPETFHVGDAQWVAVTETGDQLRAGEKCFMKLGSALVLVLKEGGVDVEYWDLDTPDETMIDKLLKDNPLYDSLKGGGTECPDGTSVDITPKQAKTQEKIYQGYVKKRSDIIAQVALMQEPLTKPVNSIEDWVTLVNETPVKHGSDYEFYAYGYGDVCVAIGKSVQVGTLESGEKVMREINSNSGGTMCPTGAKYLLPGDLYAAVSKPGLKPYVS